MNAVLTLVERASGYGVAWFSEYEDCYGDYVGESLGTWGDEFTRDALESHFVGRLLDDSKGTPEPDAVYEDFERSFVDLAAYELVQEDPGLLNASDPGAALIWAHSKDAERARQYLERVRRRARRAWGNVVAASSRVSIA